LLVSFFFFFSCVCLVVLVSLGIVPDAASFVFLLALSRGVMSSCLSLCLYSFPLFIFFAF
jgi:hypothetical protein